ncbi:permease [Synergistales bacterium]|nr:permease [Synergistales bacterium]
MFKKFEKFLEKFLEWSSTLCFAGLIGVVLLQVVARNLLPRSPHWTEEAARFLMLYMVVLAAGLAAKERAYVNVDVFVNFAHGRLRSFIQIFIDASVVVLVAVTARYGWTNAMVGRIQTSASLGITMHYIYLGMVIHSVGILFYSLLLLWNDVKIFWKGGELDGNSAIY